MPKKLREKQRLTAPEISHILDRLEFPKRTKLTSIPRCPHVELETMRIAFAVNLPLALGGGGSHIASYNAGAESLRSGLCSN
jgi:hypothetical protein